MLGKTHLFYGVTSGVALTLALLHPVQAVPYGEAALAGAVGGLLPDLDEPGSTISNAPRILGAMGRRLLRRATRRTPLYLLGLLAGILVGIAAAVLNTLSRLLSRLVRLVSGGHREGTHWLPVWVLLSVAVFLLTAPLAVVNGGPYVGAGFCAGYLSHLLGDGCTRSGIPLIPYTAARLHLLPRLLRVRTGSIGETLFTFVYAVVLVAAVYLFFAQDVVSLLRHEIG